MKKIIAMLCLVALITGCSKDNDTLTTTSLNVKSLTEMIGKQSDYVKSNFKDGTFQNESSTLGKVTLRYSLQTKDIDYSITFKTNSSNIITDIDVYGSGGNYSDGIEIYKREMDIINSSINYTSYIARYSSNTAGLIDFSDRTDFWNYVVDKDVSSFIHEIWWIENTANVKFSIDGSYARSSNAISIEINKSVW